MSDETKSDCLFSNFIFTKTHSFGKTFSKSL